ncbi:hypothetical protein ACFLT3_01130 [Chloroflexota bacterium]
MAILGNRRYSTPILINKEGSATKLRRIPFTEREFYEGWLQKLIQDNPEILPVNEIEPAFSPLVSIGKEVETDVGYIDNMFMSPQGYLTIVETKLWRNAEARREVVGQIIDYAKDVSGWNYEQLEGKVRIYNQQYRKSNLGIIDTLRLIEQIDESEEAIIVDVITRNLQRGRLLLLLVGDGIRESVEAMADFLQQTPQLLFTLALVELHVYEIAGDDTKQYLITPQIVARTREITRAVVRVESDHRQDVKISVDVPTVEDKSARGGKRFTLTEDDFFNILSKSVDKPQIDFVKQLIQDITDVGCIVEWKQASFVVKLVDPGGSGQKITLFIISKQGELNFGWLAGQLKTLQMPEEIALNFVSSAAQLFKNTRVHPKYPETLLNAVPLYELREKYSEFFPLFVKMVEQIRQSSNE